MAAVGSMISSLLITNPVADGEGHLNPNSELNDELQDTADSETEQPNGDKIATLKPKAKSKGKQTSESLKKRKNNTGTEGTTLRDFFSMQDSVSPDAFDESFSICWDFVNGHCKRGDDCKWGHSKPAKVRKVEHAKQKPSRELPPPSDTFKDDSICWDFVQGRCRRGDDCNWTHVKTGEIRKVDRKGQKSNWKPSSSPSLLPGRQPRTDAPRQPPPTSLDVAKYSVTLGHVDWEEKAFEIFKEHGFVLVEKVLKLHQRSLVLKDCEKAAKEIVGPERLGSRGSGRYSFGNTFSTKGLLHEHNFAKHLLSAGTSLLPLLDKLFEEGEEPGYICFNGGGDFVLDNVETHQKLHSDIHLKRSQNVKLPPPMVTVNFCVQELTDLNGPTRIVPGTQLLASAYGDDKKVPDPEPGEWKRSRICPVPAGTAFIRDVRVLHGGTPNLTAKIRFLPSLIFVSRDFRNTHQKQHFPPAKCLSREIYNNLSTQMQELCEEIVLEEDEELEVFYWQG